jgi:hypothetical protein
MGATLDAIKSKAIEAAKNVIGSSWSVVKQGATAQIAALVGTALYINENKDSMTKDEYESLIDQQKTAFKNVLTAYEAIGLATAQNTVAAVMKVITDAIPSLLALL